MPETTKTPQLKLHTGRFLEKWVNCLKQAKADGNPFGLEIFSRAIAKQFSEDEANAPYLAHHKIPALDGDSEDFRKKVIAKCRSINATLKRDMKGKSLPMPKKLDHSSRAFSASYFINNIDGAADFLE